MLGYCGKNIYATTRALYALENLTNTVNFDRLSPTYERRLAKYGARGIAVEVPGFDRSLVNEERLGSDFLVSSAWYYTSTAIANRYNLRLGKSPLDMLLMMERHLEHYAYRGHSQMMVKNFAHEMSDYGMTGSLNVCVDGQGHRVSALMEYLSETIVHEEKEECSYRDKITAYTPLLQRLEGSKVQSWRGLWVSNPFLSKSVSYLSAREEDFTQVLSVDPELYAILSVLRPIDFSREIEWKVTQPGEQMTNTFHSLVLEDRSIWYNGNYYNNSEAWGNYARAWRIPPEVYSMRDLLGAEEAKTTDELFRQIHELNEHFEPVTTDALRAYIAEHGIREADVLYLSNSLNRMQFPVFWTGEEIADHVAYFDAGELYVDRPFDYWSKAYPDYEVTYKDVATDGIITVCGKELSVAHLRDHDKAKEFIIRYHHGRVSVHIPHWMLYRRSDSEDSDSEEVRGDSYDSFEDYSDSDEY